MNNFEGYLFSRVNEDIKLACKLNVNIRNEEQIFPFAFNLNM